MATRSPFPGMDPWLESYWGSVHPRVLTYFCDQLAEQLPHGLYASVEETVYVVTPDWDQQVYRPDVAVIATAEREARERAEQAAGVAIAAPVRFRIPPYEVPVRHIEIRDIREGNPLVTAIELVSPVNKIDPKGRAKYIEKRDEYYAANVSVVEIDLLRAGRPLIDVPPAAVAAAPAHRDAPYKACIRPAVQGDEAWGEYYPLPLRQRLPAIRIPLRHLEPPATLDLQPPLDQVYDRGRYWMRIDYAAPPEPPLSPDDAAWAAGILRAHKTE